MEGKSSIVVDAHVHIYKCFELDILLDTALQNFSGAARDAGQNDLTTGVLLLTETSSCNWFRSAREACENNQSILASDKGWKLELTPDRCALLATQVKNRQSAKPENAMRIYIFAGRQVVTAEGLELLALGTDQEFDDGLPVSLALAAIRASGAISVFPWAVGKWLGKRGKILSDLLSREPAVEGASADFCLGDNSGRPTFWNSPSHFRQARALNVSVLPGTDPLPFADEAKRVGSFGFVVPGSLSKEHPVDDFKELMRSAETKVLTYGRLENPWRFMINQIRLRLA